MRAHPPVFCISTLLLLLLGFSGPSFGATLIPILDEETEGSRNNGLSLNGSWSTSQRYQQIWDASLFGTGPFQINSLSFRLDGQYGSSFDLTAFPGSQVYLSTSSQTSKTLGTNFDANQGLDKTLVDSNFSLSGTTGTGGANPFNVTLLFETAFFYDPTLGSLLLELVLPVVPVTSQYDAMQDFTTEGETTNTFARTSGTRILSTIGTSRVYALSSTSSEGYRNLQYGLATSFDVTYFDSSIAVPLPAGIVLLGSAAGLLAFAGGRRRRTVSRCETETS